MKMALVAGLLAAAALAGGARPADDVSVRISLADAATAGPLARLTVRNRGTNPQAGIAVAVFAESETGVPLWSGTVDLPPGGSALLRQRVFLDQDATVLVATATLQGAADARPENDADRAPLGRRTRHALVGRSIHLARCASCHGDDAAGGSAPPTVGARSKAILLEAAAGGDHDFPWLSGGDARNLGAFLRDPAAVVLPPPLPTPPPGGWPTYAGAVKPLLDDRCVSCHRAARASGGVRLDDLAHASANARRSLFQVKSGRMPQGGKRFDPSEIAILQGWIDGGRRP